MPEGIVGSSFKYVIDGKAVRDFLSLEDIDQAWVMLAIEWVYFLFLTLINAAIFMILFFFHYNGKH